MTIGAVDLGEIIGTAILVLLGNGVVANGALDKTKGRVGGLVGGVVYLMVAPLAL